MNLQLPSDGIPPTNHSSIVKGLIATLVFCSITSVTLLLFRRPYTSSLPPVLLSDAELPHSADDFANNPHVSTIVRSAVPNYPFYMLSSHSNPPTSLSFHRWNTSVSIVSSSTVLTPPTNSFLVLVSDQTLLVRPFSIHS
ncbi:hypothetical protein GEMRC1_010695 [Eukaryota sp. GEM-RC1]